MKNCSRAALALALLWPLTALAEVFVNEIHYDDVDVDNNERIEVVATAGENLSLYSVVRYNGSTLQAYGSDNVPTGSDVTCGATVRIATLSYPTDGLQNGPTDGIALAGPDGLVQFLSYEGTLTASGGVANGVLSTDIGVAETNSTAEGTSLQLGGSGAAYADFDWNPSADDNFGACNNGQTFASPVDIPPTVSSTLPTQGAIDVGVASTITLGFSESVDVNAGGWTLVCGGAGQTFAVSGSGSSRTLTPSADLPFSSACTLTLPASSVTDLDEDIDSLEADFALSFTTGADLPPSLTTSVPVDGANNFGATANLSLTFSEPVNLGTDWFSLLCSTSGTIAESASVVGGGPTTWTINPNVNLAEGETCTLTLAAAAITDQDGSPDAFAGDNTIAFTVVSNPRPTVLSTTPMQGDSSFPRAGDLVVLFSEPVTLTAGAFALDCVASTGIVLGHASSGTSFTIDTGTVLAGDDACTFTIEADAVTDAEGAHPLADTVVGFTVATDSVAGYYAKVNTSSVEQLRCSLHQTIRGHTAYPYTATSTDTWDVLNLADEDPVDSSKVLDVYKNERYTKITGGQGIYNREHTWPNTYGFSGGSPGAYTDIHMLHVTNTQYNSDRGSKPFANCDSGCTELATAANYGVGGGGGGDSNYVNDPGNENLGSFEVWDLLKGNMARAMFYMAIRYEGGNGEPDLELTDTRSKISSAGEGGKHYMGLLTDLLAWHEFDPPDARELDRNELVYSFQENRNPFVDHPEWATRELMESSQPVTCTLNSGNLPPEVLDDAYAATEDQLRTVSAPGVLDNDSDNESDAFTAMLVVDVGSGTLSLSSDGGFTYMPDQHFCGTDGFSYRANDATGSSAIALVAIEVACVNDPPTASGTLADRSGQEGQAITAFSITAGFADVDQGDSLSYSAAGLPEGLGIDMQTGMVSGTPAAGSAALSPYTVTITATDDGAQQITQQFAFTISAVPLGPLIFADGFEDPVGD